MHGNEQAFRYTFRVRYGECDGQKVVFNARYGEYVDIATYEFMRAVGLDAALRAGEFDYQLVKQTTEWKSPARFDDVLDVRIACVAVGNTSFTLGAEFRVHGRDIPVTQVQTVYVNVQPQVLSKAPITAPIRAALERGAPGVWIDHAGIATLRP